MKFTVSMKTPDALERAIYEALSEESEATQDPETGEYSDTEAVDNKAEDIKNLCKKWFRYNEHVTLEIDTVEQTCTVRSRR